MLRSPLPMHIPDGFLSLVVALALWLITIAVIAYALKRVSAELGERQVPLMGVLAAAIFAGQMLNFSVAGGTSGHLMGAAIAAILLGPWAAILVMTCVVGIQALIFQDGGLVVMGANIFNMGIVGVAVAHTVYRSVHKLAGGRKWGMLAGGMLAAWLSVETAALAVALQLAASGISPANLAIPAMAGVHAIIGVGEALITAGALAFLYASRGDLLEAGPPAPQRGRVVVWVFGLLVALALAVMAPLASVNPDGLEKVAEQLGFLENAQGPLYNIIPDYVFPGISNQALATIAAGILGTLIVFGAALALAFLARRWRSASRGQVPEAGARAQQGVPMHLHFLDPYQERSSPVHRADARLKLVLTLAFILTSALAPVGAWPAYILLFALALTVEMLSELGVGYVLKRSALALPFVLAALPVIFTLEGEPLFHLTLGGWTLQASLPGLERFASVALKSWLSVQAAILLASSTTFPDLLVAMRAIGLPRLLVAVFGLMWRYLFVLVDEVLRLVRARAARSGFDQPGARTGGSLAWRASVAGGMAGSLFLRAIERSDRIYMAMLSRGYDGEVRAMPLPALRRAHWLAAGLGLGLLALILGFAYLFWG